MLTVTGYVKHGDIYFKDPIIRIAVHFEADGTTNAEAHVYQSTAANAERKVTVPFNNLSKSLMNSASGNGRDSVMSKLETALKALIEGNNAGTTVVIS